MAEKKLIVGNWKMNTDVGTAEDLIMDISEGHIDDSLAEVVICPPHVFLEQLHLILADNKDNQLKLGVQNLSWEETGAITGDISVLMVKDWAQYAIIGHSERRKYFAETNVLINKKIKLCLKYNLIPILCVGESRLLTGDVVELGRDLNEGLVGLTQDELKRVVVAYEPIWAIGTGNPATPHYANKVMGNIRNWLKDEFGFDVAENIRILYGGSVDDKNAGDFLHEEHIDGLLVGGASLKAKTFVKIVNSCKINN
ncbi:MAG: triose-phosphate isomerase [Patescibacteria group bacterium]